MTRAGGWIQTYTGRPFYPMDPRADDIYILDIAHSLSMQCRYGGHCERFYSVAEHSIYVSRAVPLGHRLWGLLHDASEAYLVDVPRPIKPYLVGYRGAEDRVMAAVCERFGLPADMPDSVHRADTAILADEKACLMSTYGPDWSLPYPPLGVKIIGMPPADAKAAFLREFASLT